MWGSETDKNEKIKTVAASRAHSSHHAFYKRNLYKSSLYMSRINFYWENPHELLSISMGYE